MEKAIFAAGCFWGVQFYFDQVPGVTKTIVGYTGGRVENPTYEQVCSHTTGHAEAIEIEFNPKVIRYEILVRHLFSIHDATQLNRQGPDIGDQYRSAIFYFDDEQKLVAERIRYEIQTLTKTPIVTQITPVAHFYKAEEYHQKYSEKTGQGMCHISYEKI